MENFIDVNINNLETGMILAEDIVCNGRVILTKGKRLDKYVINRINELLLLGRRNKFNNLCGDII